MSSVAVVEKPRKAGLATLVYGVGREAMRQEGEYIYLTDSPGDKFYLLKGGKQFLFSSEGIVHPLFGGTDGGSIFLTPIYLAPFDVFLKQGEGAFYEALKPTIVREMEKHFGSRIKRQGDVFAVALEDSSWQSLTIFHPLLQYCSGVDAHSFVDIKDVREMPVLTTRHTLTGMIAADVDVKFVYPTGRYPIVEGVLEAPDHKPLVLNGLHLLARSAGVIDGNNTD